MKATLWRGKVDGPGLYLGTPEADYHADPCPEPSLSSHVGKLALNKSLFHAKAAHPRLTPPPEDIDEEEAPKTNYARDIGSAAHSLAFGIGAEVEEIKVKAFTTRESRILRDEARIAGKIPLKSAHYRIAQDMANIARPVILDLLKGSLVAEAMLTWQERGLWRRGLIDRMSADALTIIDYKTTSASAEPTEASTALYANDYQFQEAFYRRGLDILHPEGAGRRRFWFFYQEQEPPHAFSLIETDEAGRTMGEEQVSAACALWDRAMRSGHWPGYPAGPFTASPKPWLLSRWAERMATDETLNPQEAA